MSGQGRPPHEPEATTPYGARAGAKAAATRGAGTAVPRASKTPVSRAAKAAPRAARTATPRAAKSAASRPAARPSARGTGRSSGSRPAAPRVGSSRPGSSARSRTVPPEQRTSNAWVRGAVLASILVMLAVTLLPTARSLIRQRGEIAALQDKVVQQDQNVGVLRTEEARWKDPAYVEQQARERLKFVKVGDRSYTVIDGTKQAGAIPPAAVVAAPVADSNSPWYGRLWQSVQLADQPAAGLAAVPSK